MNPDRWKVLTDVQERLVERGVHPAVAGRIIRRALGRVQPSGSGLGRLQARSLRRDLDPSIKPRPMISGEQCVRLAETPGDETRLYQQLNDYRSRGWNVFETSSTRGFPSVRVFWACPPGRTPMESQTEVFRSEPWGAPLYVRNGGVGEDQNLLQKIQAAGESAPVTQVRGAVTPWLWVLSVASAVKSFFGKK